MDLVLSYFLASIISFASGFLLIQNGKLVYNSQTVFLSGVNIPWVHYARDFGSGAYETSRPQFEKWMTHISLAGGNAVRVWVHIDGNWSPKFDTQGLATGEDVDSLIEDLGKFLDFAENLNIFVILCLWNGAVKPQQMLHLYKNESDLERYFEKVLKPMVTGLKTKKSLGAWEVINEAGGSIHHNISDPNPCFDTKKLLHSGANWAGSNLTMKEVLNFINRHIDAIKTADSKALVTSSSWNERSNVDVCDYCFNYYKDECLRAAGGKQEGVLDFYQIHSYVWNEKFGEFSPMKKSLADLKLDKPVIIGEFAVKCSESKNASQCYSYSYDSGYSGILSWSYDGKGDCSDGSIADEGMNFLRDRVNVTID